MKVNYAELSQDGYPLCVHSTEVDDPSEVPAGYEHLHKLTNWTGKYPLAPNQHSQLKYVEGELVWLDVRTLEQAKEAKREQINQWRITATRAGFTFDGRLVSTDELGRSDIDGTNGTVALTGAFPVGWPGYWKAEDNTLIEIPDIPTWKDFYGAMAAKGAANFATSQALKVQLAAATTAAEVEAVAWPT